MIISTNRPLVPHSRVGWFGLITEEQFYEFCRNFFCKLPRDQPTRVCGTGGRLVDIIFLSRLCCREVKQKWNDTNFPYLISMIQCLKSRPFGNSLKKFLPAGLSRVGPKILGALKWSNICENRRKDENHN